MAKLRIYSVKDLATGCFMRPFFHQADNAAVRSFGEEVNRDAPDNMLFKHPGDFDLYVCGDFDDSCGLLSVCEPTKLVSASSLKVVVGIKQAG